MNVNIIISCISLIGTIIGTFGGIVVSSKLTTFRLEQLEKKVDKHNNVIERVYKLEQKVNDMEEKI